MSRRRAATPDLRLDPVLAAFRAAQQTMSPGLPRTRTQPPRAAKRLPRAKPYRWMMRCGTSGSQCPTTLAQSSERPGALRKLTNAPEWRLRIGDWRALILLDARNRTIVVTRILPRGRAYRD